MCGGASPRGRAIGLTRVPTKPVPSEFLARGSSTVRSGRWGAVGATSNRSTRPAWSPTTRPAPREWPVGPRWFRLVAGRAPS